MKYIYVTGSNTVAAFKTNEKSLLFISIETLLNTSTVSKLAYPNINDIILKNEHLILFKANLQNYLNDRYMNIKTDLDNNIHSRKFDINTRSNFRNPEQILREDLLSLLRIINFEIEKKGEILIYDLSCLDEIDNCLLITIKLLNEKYLINNLYGQFISKYVQYEFLHFDFFLKRIQSLILTGFIDAEVSSKHIFIKASVKTYKINF